MDPDELGSFLNYYLTKMSELALHYGGTIDKFIGDSVMIFFGDPVSEGAQKDANNCFNMAMPFNTCPLLLFLIQRMC